jgi:hypothetical protein
MRDYYDVISKPVCFREIQRKFADGEYSKISEFVMDVRCLLLNCYTYFGPNDESRTSSEGETCFTSCGSSHSVL